MALFHMHHTVPTQSKLVHAPELILNCRTVAAIVYMTPSNDGSIFQNRSKGPRCGLNLLRTPELISNCRTVGAIVYITPSNDRSIFQNRSKCITCGLNLLRTPELISNCGTVTTTLYITPGNDCAISMTPQGKGISCCCQLWLKYQSCKTLSVLYSASSKVCSKSTSTRFLAVISLRHFFPKARWAFVLPS